MAGACSVDAPPPENLGTGQSAVFVNGGFEAGAANAPPPSWTVNTFIDPQDVGVTIQSPQTRAGLNLAVGGIPLTLTLNAPGGPLTQADNNLGNGASLRWPRFGNKAALVNQGGNNQNVNAMAQTMTIGAGDVDPVDNQVHIRFAVAPVLQNPLHPAERQPYYFVQLTNVTQNKIVYTDFNLSAQPGVPWKTVNGNTAQEIDYTDWQLVDISPGGGALVAGDQVKLELMASGCSQGAHFGKLYVDGTGGVTVPGLFVSGTAAKVAPACSNLTYNLAYQNGSAVNETGIVVNFTTPPNTTYQSFNAPGLTCTSPAVGATGVVSCTVGNLAAGAAGSFQITVNINCAATGTIVQGNYEIHSNQETPLLGSHVNTKIGCAVDPDCSVGNWCNETTNVCTPTLPNGSPIPNDPPHTGPTLTSVCTAPAATLTCTSKVCDVNDNLCGFLNADGPCTVANGGVVCRSGVCDGADLLCGYAVNDGPCTAANAGVVCRSGACSTNLLCEPSGGCNVDADCSGGNWCNESVHACTPKLPNGSMIPTDPPHTVPVLGGTCTVPAATLVCVSGVCDTTDNDCGFLNAHGPCTVATEGVVCRSGVCDPDLLCGYAVGDGPCTVATGPVVCRSGACSTNGLCEPNGGCNVDADCSGGNWCLESTHTCTPKLTNGTAVPSDPSHTNPTLDATCTQGAATLVCLSSVCDTADDKCGYANGDGPCTLANGSVVCRSGACSNNGLCEPSGGCNVDADCTGGKWCNEALHACTDPLVNGTPVPTDVPHTNPTLDGNCTVEAGTLVCVSKVCDESDDKCGYANGDGPCTGADGSVVCRSTVCATSGANNGKCVACVDNSTCGNQICDSASNTCVGCIIDSDCGGPTSGTVCNATQTCEPGCRGSGGNGCAAGKVCTSKDNTIGTCIDDPTTSSSSSGSDVASSGAAGGSNTGGAGGASSNEVFAQGHGIFGCSTSGPLGESNPVVAGIAALAVASLRRRKRQAA